MLVYLLVACDGLDDKQEKKLKRNLSDLQAAMQAWQQDHADSGATLINDCDSDDCEDWRLGMSLPVKKKAELKPLVALFNDLAKQFHVDCEAGSIEDGQFDPVSYFGKQEGQGDAFLIAAYLGL